MFIVFLETFLFVFLKHVFETFLIFRFASFWKPKNVFRNVSSSYFVSKKFHFSKMYFLKMHFAERISR